MGQVTFDMWQVTRDTWHMTHDTWHVTHDSFQLPSSSGLGLTVFGIYFHTAWVTELINEWMNNGGDCRTAPATPGLLIILRVAKVRGWHFNCLITPSSDKQAKIQLRATAIWNLQLFNKLINQCIPTQSSQTYNIQAPGNICWT